MLTAAISDVEPFRCKINELPSDQSEEPQHALMFSPRSFFSSPFNATFETDVSAQFFSSAEVLF